MNKPVCICFHLRRATRAVTQTYDAAFRSMGLRATQMTVLGPLAMLGSATMTQLADVTGTDRTTLTRNLSLLKRKGLVTFAPGRDRREHQVAITDRGKTMLQQAHPKWEAIQRKLIKQVGQERAQRLLADLAAVVEATKCC